MGTYAYIITTHAYANIHRKTSAGRYTNVQNDCHHYKAISTAASVARFSSESEMCALCAFVENHSQADSAARDNAYEA